MFRLTILRQAANDTLTRIMTPKEGVARLRARAVSRSTAGLEVMRR